MLTKTENNRKDARKVVVVLPYVGETVLMQLRDIKSEIDFPGLWGFFGGSVELGEKPEDTARRELLEELNYKPASLTQLSTEYLPEAGNILSHCFCCSLTVSVSNLSIKEGRDWGLFSLEEIESNKLYSKKLQKLFPIVPTGHVQRCVKKLLSHIRMTPQVS